MGIFSGRLLFQGVVIFSGNFPVIRVSGLPGLRCSVRSHSKALRVQDSNRDYRIVLSGHAHSYVHRTSGMWREYVNIRMYSHDTIDLSDEKRSIAFYSCQDQDRSSFSIRVQNPQGVFFYKWTGLEARWWHFSSVLFYLLSLSSSYEIRDV